MSSDETVNIGIDISPLYESIIDFVFNNGLSQKNIVGFVFPNSHFVFKNGETYRVLNNKYNFHITFDDILSQFNKFGHLSFNDNYLMTDLHGKVIYKINSKSHIKISPVYENTDYIHDFIKDIFVLIVNKSFYSLCDVSNKITKGSENWTNIIQFSLTTSLERLLIKLNIYDSLTTDTRDEILDMIWEILYNGKYFSKIIALLKELSKKYKKRKYDIEIENDTLIIKVSDITVFEQAYYNKLKR